MKSKTKFIVSILIDLYIALHYILQIDKSNNKCVFDKHINTTPTDTKPTGILNYSNDIHCIIMCMVNDNRSKHQISRYQFQNDKQQQFTNCIKICDHEIVFLFSLSCLLI